MGKPANLRHIKIIAEAGRGRRTLEDYLYSHAGLTLRIHHLHFEPVHEQRDLSIKIKPETLPLYFELPRQNEDGASQSNPYGTVFNFCTIDGGHFLINIVKTSANVDSTAELASLLRMVDGALVIVDPFSGVGEHTQMALRRSLAERVKPILFINKIDCIITAKLSDTESLFVSLREAIHDVNDIISMHHDPALGGVQVRPEKGTVVFGSGFYGWAFTLRQFARCYSKRFGVQEEKMLTRLWGDHFFNPATKSWTIKNVGEDGEQLQRGFTHFVVDPIYKIFDAVINFDKAAVQHLLQRLNIAPPPNEGFIEGKALPRYIMGAFLPAAHSLLEAVVLNLPSPLVAQQYRTDILYDGPTTDAAALAMKNCDPGGPLVVLISKFLPTGTVRRGQKVRIQGPKYILGKKTDLFIKDVKGIFMTQSYFASVEPLEDCAAGSIVAFDGIDPFLATTGTLTDLDTTHNMRTARVSAVPVLQVAVDVRDPAQLPRLVEGMKKLSKSHPYIKAVVAANGEHIISGGDEQQLEAGVKYLQENLSISVDASEPVVSYRETVTVESSIVAMSKSPNKKTCLYVQAMPMEPDLAKAIEDADVGATKRSRIFAEANGWDLNEARKIWCFGPEDTGSNVLVDTTKGVQYINEIRDGAQSAFQWATAEVEIQCPQSSLPGIPTHLAVRRGVVLSEAPSHIASIFMLKAHLPVSKSFGLIADMRFHLATAHTLFDH
ncbi:P-loop containing nucleoside triphosphate hydrolase protein [Mycena capillaripes]|nr:P-loop containing nucleoside triphosphate hydrolase protein [Mycena capillaripes]